MKQQKIEDKDKMTAIYFRLTVGERQLIEQKMALAGVRNISAYIRKMCIDGYTINLKIPELGQCSRYLHSIVNNANQIAKHLNSGGKCHSGEFSEMKDSLRKNEKLFGSILEQLSKVK